MLFRLGRSRTRCLACLTAATLLGQLAAASLTVPKGNAVKTIGILLKRDKKKDNGFNISFGSKGDSDVQLGLLFFAMVLTVIGLSLALIVACCLNRRKAKQRNKLRERVQELEAQLSMADVKDATSIGSESWVVIPHVEESAATPALGPPSQLSLSSSKSSKKSIDRMPEAEKASHPPMPIPSSPEAAPMKSWLAGSLTESPKPANIVEKFTY